LTKYIQLIRKGQNYHFAADSLVV